MSQESWPFLHLLVFARFFGFQNPKSHCHQLVFSAPPLARALYRSTKIGQEISPGLYAAVAQVLAYLMQITLAIKSGTRWPDTPVPDIDERLF